MPRDFPNFMALPPRYTGARTAQFVVFPVAYEAADSRQAGAAAGPRAVIRASAQSPLFDMEIGRSAYEAGIHTSMKLARRRRSFKALYDTLHAENAAVLDQDRVPFVLGGEHVVAVPAVHAALEHHPEMCVLHLGARPGLHDSFAGSTWAHECALRRVLALADPPPRLVLVGARAMARSEWDLARRARHVSLFTARDIFAGKATYTKILSALGDSVYLSVDLGVFDPAHAPAVSAPEPGGLDWDWLTGLLLHVAEKKLIAGCTLSGVCPAPGHTATPYLAARLLYRIMGLLA